MNGYLSTAASSTVKLCIFFDHKHLFVYTAIHRVTLERSHGGADDQRKLEKCERGMVALTIERNQKSVWETRHV